MLRVHIKAAAAANTGCAVACAVNLSTDMTFTFTAVANADARTLVVSGIQCGSSIHIKDTDINAITIPIAIVTGCGQRGRYHGQRAANASYAIAAKTAVTGFTITGQIDTGIVQREIDGVDGHTVPVAVCDVQRRRSDPDAMTIFTVTLCVDAAGFFGSKTGDFSICIVFKIQITVVLQENATAQDLVRCQ